MKTLRLPINYKIIFRDFNDVDKDTSFNIKI